jgi:MoxR-like ATPase
VSVLSHADDSLFPAIRDAAPSRPSLRELGYFLDPNDAAMQRTIAYYEAGRPLSLVGPPGSGKTFLIEVLAQRNGHELLTIQAHEQLEWEDVVGRWAPTGLSDRPLEWIPGPVEIAARATVPTTLFIDEVAAAPPGLLTGLNGLAGGGALTHARGAGMTTIPRNPLLRIVTAFNPWADNAGNVEMSLAFLDRFRVRTFGYLEQGVEIEMLQHKFPNVPRRVIKNFVELVNATRALRANRAESTRYVATVRTLEEMCDAIVFGASPREAALEAIMPVARLIDPDKLDTLQRLIHNKLPT